MRGEYSQMTRTFIVLAVVLMATSAFSHPGRTAADGCHYCRTNCAKWGEEAGARHCHGQKSQRQTPAPRYRQNVQPQMPNEDAYNTAFCARVGGQTEVRHEYTYSTGQSYILVDCETADTVYEGGLDKRSSLDSVQQALFAAHLTGKKPAVVIYNIDGRLGRYEHRIKVACEMAGVTFYSVP